jgi:hypothetical protein
MLVSFYFYKQSFGLSFYILTFLKSNSQLQVWTSFVIFLSLAISILAHIIQFSKPSLKI